MEHKEIIKELNQGICEVTWLDSFGVEYKTSGTLSTSHLNDDFTNPYEKQKQIVSMWDMVAEDWVEIDWYWCKG